MCSNFSTSSVVPQNSTLLLAPNVTVNQDAAAHWPLITVSTRLARTRRAINHFRLWTQTRGTERVEKERTRGTDREIETERGRAVPLRKGVERKERKEKRWSGQRRRSKRDTEWENGIKREKMKGEKKGKEKERQTLTGSSPNNNELINYK